MNTALKIVLMSAILMSISIVTLMTFPIQTTRDLPVLKFYKDSNLVNRRHMTDQEYQKWIFLKRTSTRVNTSKTPDHEETGTIGKFTSKPEASDSLLGQSHETSRKEHLMPRPQSPAVISDMPEVTVNHYKYAKRVERAAAAFENEVRRNSSTIEYDIIRIGERSDLRQIQI